MLSVTLTNSLIFGTFWASFRHFLELFEILTKSGKSSLPPLKDRQCLLCPDWDDAYQIGLSQERVSDWLKQTMNDKDTGHVGAEPKRNFF